MAWKDAPRLLRLTIWALRISLALCFREDSSPGPNRPPTLREAWTGEDPS